MLEIKRAVFPSPEQWDIVVSGCRNAYKSWERSDTLYCKNAGILAEKCICYKTNCKHYINPASEGEFAHCGFYKYREGEMRISGNLILGPNDKRLLKDLCNAQSGEPSHSKFLRQLPVILDIRAPLYWWKQMDKYQIGTVTNSESTMHTVMKDEFDTEQFSLRHTAKVSDRFNCYVQLDEFITDTIESLNYFRKLYLKLRDLKKKLKSDDWTEADYKRFFLLWERIYCSVTRRLEAPNLKETGKINVETEIDKAMKDVWYAVIEILPESYMQTRTWSANYEVLRKIVKQRSGHPLNDEWGTFIDWMHENVPMAEELIFNNWD